MRKPTLQKRKIPQTTVQFHHETLAFPDVSCTPLYLASPWTGNLKGIFTRGVMINLTFE